MKDDIFDPVVQPCSGPAGAHLPLASAAWDLSGDTSVSPTRPSSHLLGDF